MRVVIVWSAHLDSEPNAFVVPFCQVKHQSQVIGKVETPRPWLDFSPGGAYVKFLSERETNEIFNRLRNIVRPDLCRSHVRRDVSDQSLTVARNHSI